MRMLEDILVEMPLVENMTSEEEQIEKSRKELAEGKCRTFTLEEYIKYLEEDN